MRHWIDLLEAADPLQEKYAYYNRLLFDGILPTIPITWATLKNIGGVANAKLIIDPATRRATRMEIRLGLKDKHSGRKVDPASIAIRLSSTYKRSEQATDAILIHEMIHVYFFVTGRPGENHGLAFLKMVRQCSQKVGFEVPIRDVVDGLELNDQLAAKLNDIGVILGRKRDGMYVYAIFGVNALRANQALLIDKVSYLLKYNYWKEGWIGTIVSPAWTAQSLKMPILRKWTGKFFILRDPPLVADLMQNGVALFKSDTFHSEDS